jgi:hypothetical protein
MTLADVAGLLDAEPKWVLNTLALVGRRRGRYTMTLTRRLAVARAVQVATGMPVGRAFDLAARALRRAAESAPVTLDTGEPHVSITIDLPRLLSSLSIRSALRRTTIAPRQRGRPPRKRRDPVTAAREWGLDTSLLADNLRKSPQERLRELDAMMAFARTVQRRSATAS